MKLPVSLHGIFLLLTTASAFAQLSQTWNTNTAGSNWSNAASWTPAGSPAANNVTFGDAFGKGVIGTIGNVVDQSFTVNSLTYNHTGTTTTSYQVTGIGAGLELLVNSAAGTPPGTIFTVGGVTSASTRVVMQGAGTFTIDEAASNISVGGPTAANTSSLEMNGLANFNANVAVIEFGGTGSRANGDVTLANSNVITAATLNLGTANTSTTGGSKSDLLLGTGNILHLDNINVGLNFASGSIKFRSGLTSPGVTIRGNVNARANLTVGNTNAIAVSNTQGSDVDFQGGNLDAQLDSLIIARRGDSGTQATYANTFKMDTGTVDVNAVTLAQSAGTGVLANSTTGSITLAGGTFTVNNALSIAQNTAGATSVAGTFTQTAGTADIKGGVVMGVKSGTATSVTANVAISGGVMMVGGNLVEGAGAAGVTSTVALSGTGQLEMKHGAISVDTFTFTGGKLKNVANFSAATTGGLTMGNNTTLSYDLDAQFTSLSLTGGLSLSGSSNLELTLANGFAPAASYILVANDDVDFTTGAFATINGAAFGPGNTFSLANNLGTYQYALTYTGDTGNDMVIQSVPEPALSVLLGLAGLGGLIGRRRR